MGNVHIPMNDFIPPHVSQIPNEIAFSLKIVGNQTVKAGQHYLIKQINDTEAIIEEASE